MPTKRKPVPSRDADVDATPGLVALPGSPDSPSAIVAATAASLPQQPQALLRARAFAEPLLASEQLDTGENILAHADAVAEILRQIGGSEAMQAASYLVYACEHLNRPQEVIAKAFGETFAALAVETTKLVQLQRQARIKAAQAQAKKLEERVAAQDAALPMPSLTKQPVSELAASQTENVRKMLLAFSRDLRVVMLRLASRLQTLRFYAASKGDPGQALASEALHVFAPLANRLGIWRVSLSGAGHLPRGGTFAGRKARRTRKPRRAGAPDAGACFGRARRYRLGAGAAQTHLQHRQKNAGQRARFRACV